ncbi:hypothetical protein FRC03_002974 [Tulasnella sp. 419]|nr:hypothetical protein FRC03_002974 [Tulasnella sp. 419]
MQSSHQCPTCLQVFRKSRFLSSHVRQSLNCQWDFINSSDSGVGEMSSDDTTDHQSKEDESDIEDLEYTPVDDETNFQDALNLTTPIEPEIVDPKIAYANAKKGKAQIEAEQPAIVKEVYKGAGKVKEVDQTAYDAWKAQRDSTNPYRPFKNKLDWEVGKWAKQNGPTSTAVTDGSKFHLSVQVQ